MSLGLPPLLPRLRLRSVISSLSHRFSVSKAPIRFRSSSHRSVMSRARRSNSASRSFFFSRNRALAAVLRRRLSSSITAVIKSSLTGISSLLSAEACKTPKAGPDDVGEDAARLAEGWAEFGLIGDVKYGSFISNRSPYLDCWKSCVSVDAERLNESLLSITEDDCAGSSIDKPHWF